jgi:hypothetical protein
LNNSAAPREIRSFRAGVVLAERWGKINNHVDNPYHDDYPAEGVLKSNDGGNTWRHVNAGLSHRGIQSLSINPHDPSLLYAGTSGNGAFVGKDADVGRRPIKVR